MKTLLGKPTQMNKFMALKYFYCLLAAIIAAAVYPAYFAIQINY